jgi:hypothetical protein
VAEALCRLGRQAEALAVLRAALEAGHCWHSPMLRAARDLAPLWAGPGGRLVLAESERMIRSLDEAFEPAIHLWNHEAGGRGAPVLLVLGGAVRSPAEWARAWGGALEVDTPIAVATPTQLRTSDYPALYFDELDRSARDLSRCLGGGGGWLAASRLVLAGYSRAGYSAIGLALRQTPIASEGFLAALPGILGDMPRLLTTRRGQVRGWIMTAADDPFRSQAEEVRTALVGRGHEVAFEVGQPAGHVLPPDLATRSASAFRWVLGS